MLDFLSVQPFSPQGALFAALFSAALSHMGLRLGVLTRGGALAAFATGFGVLFFEPRLFPALFAMVVLGEASTRIRVQMDLLRARASHRSEPAARESGSRSGESQIDAAISASDELPIKKFHKPRGAGSVFGNGGVALLLAASAGIVSHFEFAGGVSPEFLLFTAASGALAAAAADTVSGEIGRALRAKAVLITTLKPVEIGSNGGVSLAGTLAGIAAAAVIALIAVLFVELAGDFDGVSAMFILIVTFAGALGGVIDSFLGATVENRRFFFAGKPFSLGNDGVNFFCTLAGAVLAAVFVWFLG